MGQQRESAYLHISHDPDEKACRGGYHNGPAQYEQGSVQNGTDDDFANLRPAVGRQLQGEGGRDTLQHSGGEEFRDGKGHEHTQHDKQGQ